MSQAPPLGAFSFFPGAAIRFSVDISNAVVVVQRTTDLLNWQTVGSNNVVNGIVTLADPTAGVGPAQFYRIYINP